MRLIPASRSERCEIVATTGISSANARRAIVERRYSTMPRMYASFSSRSGYRPSSPRRTIKPQAQRRGFGSPRRLAPDPQPVARLNESRAPAAVLPAPAGPEIITDRCSRLFAWRTSSPYADRYSSQDRIAATLCGIGRLVYHTPAVQPSLLDDPNAVNEIVIEGTELD